MIYILVVPYIILALLILVKFFLFFRSTSHKTFARFFYYSFESIYNSKNPKSERAKILQNNLSVAIIITLFVALICTLIILG